MWIVPRAGGAHLRLLIQPRASKTEVVGPHGDPPRLRIRVAAPPVDGEANAELVAFLAKRLGIPKSAVRVVGGASGRNKNVEVEGVEAAQVERALLA